jgi:TM2 domain-containing membrane protein YozV
MGITGEALVPTQEVSERSRGVALILGGALGVFGAHRFYTGKVATGILQLCTMGGFGLWWLYDMILITAGSFRDADEKRVWHWWEPNPQGMSRGQLGPQFELVLEELDMMRGEMNELGERVDFMERVLTRTQERDALPRPAGEH